MTSQQPTFEIPPEVFDPERFERALKGSKSRIPLFKKNIERTSDYLHQHFQHGDQIRELIWARSWFIDQLLSSAWSLFDWPDDASLVAVGGYGRGELHPQSDIDILILFKNDDIEQYSEIVSDFVTLLWDINLDIGHSVRSVNDCLSEAASDITIATNIMESRTITGPRSIHAQLMSVTGTDNIWPSREFFRAKWDEQINRHRKHGNSEYNLEPNVKSSPGGLRDIQMIAWIAKRHFGITNFEDFYEQGLLLKEELDLLNKGIDYLWRVRYALHMISGREEDRLLFDHQRTLAKMFGFDDENAQLAVEQFMQEYYQIALSLGQLNDVLIQYFDESILRSNVDSIVKKINPRFRVHNGHIEVISDDIFDTHPPALMEVFVLMANNHDIDGARASTIRLIRNRSKTIIDDQWRNDPLVIKYFMKLLRSPTKVALVLRRMLRFGVLGNYLPEFGEIIGQMQHDLFHIYSVDAHTMEVVKNMRRFHYQEMEQKFPVASRIVKRLEKVELLYIAGLYHDIGKGRGGNHSLLGAVDARAFCERHELNNRDTNLIVWLVENHLLMSSFAQRKDISDPEVIHEFTEIVGNQSYLDYLYTLTVADINATNPKLWNSWRASLLRQLYAETKRALRRGLEKSIDTQEWIEEKQVNAIDQLENLGFVESEIRRIWANIGEDYFLREKIDDIVWHTEAIAQHTNLDEPLVLIKESSNLDFEGATQIFIHTRANKSIFPLMTAALEQLDLNVQDARIYDPGRGFTLDTFYVLDDEGEALGEKAGRIKNIMAALKQHLIDPDQYCAILTKRTPRQMRLFSMPTEANISTDHDKGHSILEVITPDRPGLLARIGQIFHQYDIQLQTAKITTLGERVEDLFFITDDAGKPIEDEQLQKIITGAICKELDQQLNVKSN